MRVIIMYNLYECSVAANTRSQSELDTPGILVLQFSIIIIIIVIIIVAR